MSSIPDPAALITIFLCGDVMTGRGIDQVLPHPSDPVLYEPYLNTALGYVDIAEKTNGPIPLPVDYSYIWGDGLDELERVGPDVRIINLETSVTENDAPWPEKGIHYRMHPANVSCLLLPKIDCCVLANNHVLDWSAAGLAETLRTLQLAGLKYTGAGRNLDEARSPVELDTGGNGKVVVFAFGSETSGIPAEWAASPNSPGIHFLPDLSQSTIRQIQELVRPFRQAGKILVASIHWGPNWGYRISREERSFAHSLIDRVGFDLVHGHSSHHVKGMEVYRDRLILYGCGDFLNDYEGIGGFERFRDDLGLMYFPTLDPATGRLIALRLTPTRIRNFRVNRATEEEALWLQNTLNREGKGLGTHADLDSDSRLTVGWEG